MDMQDYKSNVIKMQILKKNAKLFANMRKKVYLCIVFVRSIMFLRVQYIVGHVYIVKADMRHCAL